METYFLSSGVILKNLETFFLGKLFPEMLRSLENLQTSSDLLGFISVSRKARKLMDFLSQHTESEGGPLFASKLSDLNMELRLGQSEWVRARESLESSKPHEMPEQGRPMAFCRRR